METNFNLALDHVLDAEQGFQDDPRDRGNRLPDGRVGCTNLGVTQATWESYVGHPVSREDMKKLDAERVARLYKHKYWDAVYGDLLPDGIDYLVFDFAVNAGPGRAVKLLQDVVGVTTDGAIGPKTLTAIKKTPIKTLIIEYTQAKEDYYKSCKEFPIYGKGWLIRTAEAKKIANTLIG
jgi:lysozyme family protein